jgi:hypothetical protein
MRSRLESGGFSLGAGSQRFSSKIGDAAVANYDQVYFEKQLDELPLNAQGAVILRAGLRAVPNFMSEAHTLRRKLDMWRSLAISALVNSVTNADYAKAAEATAEVITSDAAAAARRVAEAMTPAALPAAIAVDPIAGPAADLRAAAAAARQASLTMAAAAANYITSAAAAAAFERDVNWLKAKRPKWFARVVGKQIEREDILAGLSAALWLDGLPEETSRRWTHLRADLLNLNAGFEVWVDWYRNRLEGKPFDWDVERKWALLSEERLAQSPAEINAYLKELRDGSLTKQLKRVRAIFIGEGEVGKTSLINVLLGGEAEPADQTTEGVAIGDAIHKRAGVFTRVTNFDEDDLTVHFWDFGGQVIAHATHRFFLRSKCLYVIVLSARADRNPDEDAEYWLEHVRAFGDSSPVLLVGNKADVMPFSLDLRTLKDKYPNIVDFYLISCTQAKGAFHDKFEFFRKEFLSRLQALAERADRFSSTQFRVLKTIEERAKKDDFLEEAEFDEICRENGIPMEGAGGRDSLLDIFDKLGIVMHFDRLPFLTDYVLNPRWLTYGVYKIIYSREAAKGRLSEASLVAILEQANPLASNTRASMRQRERWRIIADAMIAFQVAYRLNTGELVIPALLPGEQPVHDFNSQDAFAFRFDFSGFLPRHVLPGLVVEYFQDIAKVEEREIVWQNGVLLNPKRYHARAFLRADYHRRTLDLRIKGSDATAYLGKLRDSILGRLESMPQLLFEEKVELRPDMLIETVGPTRQTGPVWIAYEIVQTALRRGDLTLIGPGGVYDMRRVLAALPARSDRRQADIFLSYSSEDGEFIERLADELERAHYAVWYDRGLIVGQPYRDVLQQRIGTVKAVVVLWSENSIRSKWVRAEADVADRYRKLICLRAPNLDLNLIPLPFGEMHVGLYGEFAELLKALELKGVEPRG